MSTLEQRLDKIEQMLAQVLETMPLKIPPVADKWLTEPQVMEILNLTKRAMRDIRKGNKIRTSSATGRNFKYYRTDVEHYLYDNSVVKRRTSIK